MNKKSMLENLLQLSLEERIRLIENTIRGTNVVSQENGLASQNLVIRNNVTTFSNILISIVFCLGALTAKAQNGYIYVHNKALDESSSVDFSYSVTGGTTTIPTFTLNDIPDQTTLLDIGAAENGRLWAVSRSNELYYRDANSTSWVKTSITDVSRVDGGPSGTCFFINTGGTVYSFSGTGTATQISTIGQFNFAPWADIASGWTGTPTSSVVAGPSLYVVRDNGNIYKYSGTGTTWNVYASIASSSQYRVDVNPANGNVYVGGNAGSVRTIREITSAASPVITSLGSPVTDWSAYRDLAVNENGEIYATAFDNYVDPKGWYVFKYTSGTTWAKELGSFDGSEITGGIANSMWLTMNSGGWGGSVATYPFYNIFSRAYNGSSVTYIDDERVRTTTGNSQLIPVAPGTYTLTEAVAAGWGLQNILLYDPTANSSSNILTGTATINVSAGEVVHVVFQNGLDNPFTMTTSCATAYLETFGVGSAVGSFGSVATGQTSYHYLSNNAPGEDGHYKLVNRANPDFNTWGGALGVIDHTPGDGSLGYMYAVNAGYDKGEFFRRRFNGVIPGAKYTFSAWIVDLTPSAAVNPNVSFQVLDHTTQAVLGTYNTGDLTSIIEPDTWQQYGFTFTASSADIDLVINNNGVGGNGNDLAIDDISFAMSPADTPVTTVVHTGCGVLGSITVSSPLGTSYEYSKDGFVSSIQSSPVFGSLSPSIYTISARYVGTTGCVTSKLDTIGAAICGNIWDDANGDATNISENPITSGVWVNLVNPSTGAVLKSVQVDASGNYSFTGLPQSTNYQIILSNTDQTGVSSLTTSSLPTGFVATGTNLSGIASTTNKTGIISVNTGTSGITQQNFGIEQPPTATPKAFTVATTAFSGTPPATYPAVSGYASIISNSTNLTGYGTTGGLLSGTDPEDCPAAYACNSGSTFTIGTINSNTLLYYDFGSGPVAITTGTVITGYDPSKLVIYGALGSGTVGTPIGFTYSITDAAGEESPMATYEITSTTVLPIQLLQFTATKQGGSNSALVDWLTGEENVGIQYHLQHSTTGQNWTNIAMQKANNKGLSENKYSYVHSNLTSGKHLYRLLIVDIDDAKSYSPTRNVVIEGTNNYQISLYPNPVADKFTIITSDGSVLKSIGVYNMKGQQLQQLSNVVSGTQINMSQYPAGIYMIKTIDKEGVTGYMKITHL